MEPKPQFRDADTGALQGQTQYDLSQQQTLPQPIVTAPPIPLSTNVTPSTTPGIKRKLSQVFAIVLTLVVAVALFFTWHAPPTTATPPAITQQNTNGAPSSDSSSTSTTNSGDIQVYVVGAIKHPGVYTLPADARIFQLLQAAGGTLSNANLVALNLAAKLSDGEEVYVLAIGEVPPTICNRC